MSTVKGHIIAQVLNEKGELVREYAQNNFVTNKGLTDSVKTDLGVNIALGQGQHPDDMDPTIGGLNNFTVSHSGTWSSVTNSLSDGDYVVSVQRLTVEFPVETSGKNYTELGIFESNKDALWTYALFEDSQGTPTTVTVVTGERLRVLYDLKFRIPHTETFSLTVGGVPTTVTQTVLEYKGNGRVRLPETGYTDQYGYFSPMAIPDPLSSRPSGGTRSDVDASIGNGSFSFSPASTNWSSGGDLHMLVSGKDYQVSWHFDPAVPMSEFETIKVSYTSTFIDELRESEENLP